METVLIILAIIWIIVPIAMRKKQQQAKAEAERQRVARERAPQPAVQARTQQPMRTAPLTPSIREPMQASYEGTASQEGNFSGSLEGTSRQNASFSVREAQSTLTDSMNSISHTVTVSSESGHAHEETSASGIKPDCPPDQTSATKTAPPVLSAESAFLWDSSQVHNGLVMAEILGPCLTLRD